MMIKDLELAHEMSHDEQVAVYGGAQLQGNFGDISTGNATLIASQLGIGNVALLVNTPIALNLGVNVGTDIAPDVTIAPQISANAGMFFFN